MFDDICPQLNRSIHICKQISDYGNIRLYPNYTVYISEWCKHFFKSRKCCIKNIYEYMIIIYQYEYFYLLFVHVVCFNLHLCIIFYCVSVCPVHVAAHLTCDVIEFSRFISWGYSLDPNCLDNNTLIYCSHTLSCVSLTLCKNIRLLSKHFYSGRPGLSDASTFYEFRHTRISLSRVTKLYRCILNDRWWHTGDINRTIWANV